MCWRIFSVRSSSSWWVTLGKATMNTHSQAVATSPGPRMFPGVYLVPSCPVSNLNLSLATSLTWLASVIPVISSGVTLLRSVVCVLPAPQSSIYYSLLKFHLLRADPQPWPGDSLYSKASRSPWHGCQRYRPPAPAGKGQGCTRCLVRVITEGGQRRNGKTVTAY